MQNKISQELMPHLTFKDKLAIIDGVVMKNRRIRISTKLQPQALEQLHINHKGMKKTRLLEKESVYWVNMYSDIKRAIKNCTLCLTF